MVILDKQKLILIKTIFMAPNIRHVEFEVFGRVQGVFFRKYTQQEGKKLGLTGWCMNTDSGTVTGVMEGDEKQIAAMKNWLKETGSPDSRIERAVFKNEKTVEKSTFQDFTIRR